MNRHIDHNPQVRDTYDRYTPNTAMRDGRSDLGQPTPDNRQSSFYNDRRHHESSSTEGVRPGSSYHARSFGPVPDIPIHHDSTRNHSISSFGRRRASNSYQESQDLGSEMKGDVVKIDTVTVPMDPIKMTFKEAFPAKLKGTLTLDFEIIKQMSVISTESEKYTMLRMSPSLFHNKKYFLKSMITKYKKHKDYAPLFAKYGSLKTWAETVLGIIIYHGPAKLEEFCSNLYLTAQTIEEPDSAFPQDDEVYIRVTEETQKENVETPQKKIKTMGMHPFFDTKVYQDYCLAFELGKVIELCVPSQFAPLTASIDYTQVRKLPKTKLKGLRIRHTPAIGILGSRQDAEANIFSRIEDFSNYKEALTNMTDLIAPSECFTYGHKKKLACINIVTGEKDKAPAAFDKEDGFYMAIIGEFSAFQLSNGMITCKGYTEVVYHYEKNYNEMSDEKFNNCKTFNLEHAPELDSLMTEYEKSKV